MTERQKHTIPSNLSSSSTQTLARVKKSGRSKDNSPRKKIITRLAATERRIHKIDAAKIPLGRLATQAAILLRGKHKPDFVPYLDRGDYVVVTNYEKIILTGRKREQKIYYHHSGYPGHLKETPVKRLLASRPEEVIRRAVYQMLPKNKLRAKMIKRLKFES